MGLLSNNIKSLNEKDFTDCGSLNNPVYSQGVTTVFFYMPGCRFCKTMAPEYEKFASMCAAKSNCNAVAVNIDENRNLVDMSAKFPYNINAFPLTVVYFEGEPCAPYLGPRTAANIFEYVNKLASSQQCSYISACRYKPPF